MCCIVSRKFLALQKVFEGLRIFVSASGNKVSEIARFISEYKFISLLLKDIQGINSYIQAGSELCQAHAKFSLLVW